MSIFRNLGRIVLFDGTVIMPDEITRLEVCFINGVDSVEIQTKTRGLYNSQFRTDRPTGMKDRTGKDIFERDKVMTPQRYTGTIIQHYASWRVSWDDPKFISDAWGEVFTITGMVPWEDGR